MPAAGNQAAVADDLHPMRCDDVREVLSARLDGEAVLPGDDDPAIDRHVASCTACQGFAEAAARHHRAVRVRPAEPVPDLTAAILAGVAPLAPRPIREWARYALFVVAATMLLVALPGVLTADGSGALHASRELASTETAVAIGFLWAAWQPRRAGGLLPFAVALGGMMLVTAVVDIAVGDAAAGAESVHLLELAGVGLLWALAHPPRHPHEHAPARAVAA